MKIGDMAEEANVSVDTVRYYERRGLLPGALRTEGGYRVYTEADVLSYQVRRL